MTTNSLLDVEEAAQFCRVKPATIRAWILARRIEFVKLGRRVFVRQETLEKLIKESTVPVGAR